MVAVATAAAAILVVAGAVAAAARLVCEGCSNSAGITLVATAGTVEETDVAITGTPADLVRQVSEENGHSDLIKVDGDGATTVTPYDLTPRDSNGTELKPVQRRQAATDALIADLTRTMNEFDSSVPGRSVLAGLQAVPAGGSGPILVYTSAALDTNDPMSMIALGFDVDAETVVKQLKDAKELPANLRGRDIIFVLTPVAGAQKAPRQPQQLYIKKLLTAVVKAGGAANVEFMVGQGGLPAGTGGNAPVVPIPDPIGTLKPETSTGTDQNGGATIVTECVLPSAVLFEPNSSTLLNENDAEKALAKCLRYKTAKTSVLVEGHTACRGAPDSDPAYAKTLSEDRARRIVDLVVNLGVPRRNIRIRGWGASKPLVKPCSDPANRATVATITTPKKETGR